MCKERTRVKCVFVLSLVLLIRPSLAFPPIITPTRSCRIHYHCSTAKRWTTQRQNGPYLPCRGKESFTLESAVSNESRETLEEDVSKQREKYPATTKQRWITCSSTKELTHAIQRLVKPTDTVAELGSQLREVSTTICESIQSTSTSMGSNTNNISGIAVLVDTVRKFPKEDKAKPDSRTRAMRRAGDEDGFFPHCASFHEIDRLDDWRAALFSSSVSTTAATATATSTPTYDVFVLDVNSIVGNDLEWTTLSIIREFLALNDNKCRLVLVKSLSLNQWASRLIHGQRWCRQKGAPIVSTASGNHQGRPSGCYVVATVGVPEYRETIPYTLRGGDSVLEIGCHLGTSTVLLHSAAAASNKKDSRGQGYCIGVDIGSKIIKGAQKRHSQPFFAVGDAWCTAALLRTQQEFLLQTAEEEGTQRLNQRIGFDIVYVDVGGLSGQDGVIESLALISALANAFEPRCIVIKSLCMRRLSSVLVPHWKQQQMLE